jgi:hypothetical protein
MKIETNFLDIYSIRMDLISISREIESANTLEMINNCLQRQFFLWDALRRHFSNGRDIDLEIRKLSNYVLRILNEHSHPNDQYLLELAGINLRASALLNVWDPCSKADRVPQLSKVIG